LTLDELGFFTKKSLSVQEGMGVVVVVYRIERKPIWS